MDARGRGGRHFFTDNDEFLGANVREQEPLYSLQGTRSTIQPRALGCADATYYTGGRTR
jgi:hypothetical protein